VSAQSEFARIARDGGRAALVSVIEGEGLGSKLLVTPEGRSEGTLGSAELDALAVGHAEELMWAERSERRESLFVDVVAPRPRLIVFGAVDFAEELCRMARAANWRPYVVDPRSQFATEERFPSAEEVIPAWPEQALAQLGGIDRATYIAVLTHDPKLDDAALTIALRSEAPYIGAMGSRRTQERRRERLLAAGLGDHELERLSAPIGLDLGGDRPQEIALAIMGEVVAVRNGREGGRMSRRAQEVRA
jgi:xanthine dehydrogenase accessory factor